MDKSRVDALLCFEISLSQLSMNFYLISLKHILVYVALKTDDIHKRGTAVHKNK